MGADGERNVCHAPVLDPEECASSAAAFLLLRVSPHDLSAGQAVRRQSRRRPSFL